MAVRNGFILLLLLPAAFAQPVPHPQMARYTEAWKLTGLGKWDDAIRGMKSVIADDPTFWRAYQSLAGIGVIGQVQEIETYFGQLARIDPSSPWPHYGLAVLSHYDSNRGAETALHYRECIQRSSAAYVCGMEWTRMPEPFRATPQDVQPLSQPGALLPQGLVLHLQGRHEEAIRLLQSGLERAEALHQWDLVVFFHEALRGAYRSLSLQRPEILPHLEGAFELARQIQDVEAQLRIMQLIAWSLGEQGHKEEAMEWSQRCLEEATAIGHLGYQRDALELIGRQCMDRGEPEKALEVYVQADNLSRTLTGGPDDTILRSMAGAYHRLGRYPEAMRVTEGLLQSDERQGRKYGEALDLRQIGALSLEMGDYFRALRASIQSVNVFEGEHADWPAGAGLGNIGLVYAELGDNETAVRYLRQSFESGRKFGDLGEQQRNLQDLGDLYLRMGQPSRAIESLNKATQLFTAVGNKEFNIGVLLGLAEARSRLGQRAPALAAAREAEKLARSLGSKPVEADALERLGEREMEAGELAAAERDLRAALLQAQDMPLASVTAAAEIALAALARRRHDLTGALRELEPAVRAIESMRASIAEPDLKARFLETKARVYDEIVEVLSLLHGRQPNSGYDKLAFDYAERGRARRFLDMLAESRSRITKGMTEAQQARRASLVHRLSDASDKALKEPSETSRQAVDAAEKNLADFVQELGHANPAFRELQYPEPYTTAEAQALANQAGCTILAYHLGGRRSQLWVVNERGVRMLTLPDRGRISAEVKALRRALNRRPTGESEFQAYSDHAGTLYQWLFAPARGFMKPGGKILIVPDGILHYLPFEVLVRSETKRFVLEDFTIAYAPSVSTYGHLRNERRSGAGQRSLLAFADPVFPTVAAQPSEQDLVRGIYERGGMQFVRLPSTRKEVESIASLYKPADRKVYFGRQATKAALQHERLAGYRVLHLATHAIIDERVPARSGVVLSSSGAEDGILRVPDVFNLDLDADLVVLSACQTGLGKLVKGEGMVGLTRSFLYAGSSRIAVSLWEVNDLATAELMESFYRGMRGGLAPPAALRAAKLTMLRSATPAYRHPYFWAPFVITGLF